MGTGAGGARWARVGAIVRGHRVLAAIATVLLVLVAALALRALLGQPVATVVVERRALVQTVVMSGRVRAPEVARLSALVSGTVSHVAVEEGDPVLTGQVLVTLDDAQWTALVARTQAALDAARAQLRRLESVNAPQASAALAAARTELSQAERDYARTVLLVEGGSQAPVQLEAARTTLDLARSRHENARLQVAGLGPGGGERATAQAAVEQAFAAVQEARARLAQTRIDASSGGIVLRREVDPGDVVQVGTPLLVIARIAPTELVAEPDEKTLSLIAPGQSARASADAFPSVIFPARVLLVSPSVDLQRGTIEVRLSVPAPPPFLRPDMTVSIEIEVTRRASTLVLPAEVLRGSAAAPWVLRVDAGRARRTDVKLGITGEGAVEILAGLREGDQVVPPTERGIDDGDRVRPRAPRRS